MTASGRRTKRDRPQVNAIVARLHRQYREADLGNLRDPIDELVYISLTRQTHRQNANRSWNAIMEIGGPARLLEVAEEDLEGLLRPSGFSKQKARWIKRSLQLISEEMGELSLQGASRWSNQRLEAFLCSLPGIKIKSAKCIMMYSMNRQVLPVDTHVRRVATRAGLVPAGLSERAIHAKLEELVPAPKRYSFHVNCIWHGRRVCTALRPRCAGCPVRDVCDHASSRDVRDSAARA